MEDLISKQAAISAICSACGKIDCDKMDKCEKLQLPPANCSEFPNNSDAISRQAAIEAIDTYIDKFDAIDANFLDGLKTANKLMMQLPPAQLARIADGGKNDCVSRQAAIDGLRDYLVGERCPDDGTLTCRLIENEVINKLPPIQPKRGRWILDRSGAYCCSECMEPCAGYVMMKPRDRFCKMCGSRNEVTE